MSDSKMPRVCGKCQLPVADGEAALLEGMERAAEIADRYNVNGGIIPQEIRAEADRIRAQQAGKTTEGKKC